MRRSLLVCVTVFLAVGLACSVSFSANAQTASQYDPSQGDSASDAAPPGGKEPSGESGGTAEQGTAPEAPVLKEPVPVAQAPESVLLPQGTPSQGSAVEGPGLPEENFPAYSQVVDNGSSGRFQARGWDTASSSPDFYGEDYGVARDGKGTKPARYKVKIPATGTYSIYAWWPAEKSNDSATRYGVRTTSGVKWTEVDQQRDGGFWVKLGEYRMAKGDGYAVQVAQSSKGEAVADAVAVVRGVQSGPPAARSASEGGDATMSTRSFNRPSSGADVVRRARAFMGRPYKYASCTKSGMSCTCLTKVAIAPTHTLNLVEQDQWNYKGSVYLPKSKLQPGDEVFFKEGGSRAITHVGIYSGNGNIVHASSYWGKVVEKKMKYIDGYYGAKRFKFR